MNVKIRLLEPDDIEPIVTAFENIGWNKPASLYEKYLSEQRAGTRTVLTAFDSEGFAGYLTIIWQPDYKPIRDENIPEINDLNVLPHLRRRGIATQLMDTAEEIVAQRLSTVGLGVGLTADYAPAHRLYLARGYLPDSQGIAWKNQTAPFGTQVAVDDDLVLFFVKTLN
jgi:GNAT superfamily N-acetyltransferase